MKVDIFRELSQERLQELIMAPCEAGHLDFKEMLDPSTPRDRAELAKDVLAMANSGGGHIVIGIEDGTRRVVGVSKEIAREFADSKSINDKLLRFSGGHVTVVVAQHCLKLESTSPTLILIYVSPSDEMIPAQADGCYEGPNHRQTWVFRKGDVYVRKGDQSVKVETPGDLRRPRRNKPITLTPQQPASDLADFENPYDFATAARKKMFKGRQLETAELLAAIESGTHTAIFGLQRMGKTSLVRETLEDKIDERPTLRDGISFAMLDFQRLGTHYTTYKAVLQEIVKIIAEKISPEQLSMVKEQFATFNKWYEARSKQDMLKGYSALIYRLAAATRRRIVLFLDEFSELCIVVERNERRFRLNPEWLMQRHPHETLVDLDLMQWFSSLSKSTEIKNKIVFLFALRPFMAEYDARHNLQVLKVLKPITLYHLDETAAKALIVEPLVGHIIVDDQATDYLYKLTSGHPYLIQFILKELVDRAKRGHRPIIHMDDVKRVEHIMISEGPAYDAQFNVLDSDYSVDDVMDLQRAKLGKGVLALIARLASEGKAGGWVNTDRICAGLSIHNCSPEDTYQLLDQLCRAKILEERELGGILCFRIAIPLLRKRYVRQNLYVKYFPAARAVGHG